MRDRGQASVTLYSVDSPRSGEPLTLGGDAARHVKVLRMQAGNPVRISDGRGTMAAATLRKIGRDHVVADVVSTAAVDQLAALHLLVPIADKDRLLLLAEKAVELGVSTWRPVQWKRSRNVTSRGEGPGFTRKLTARMIAALEQSGAAWLPDIFPECPLQRAIAAAPEGTRLLCDPRARAEFPAAVKPPLSIAVGPEGGMMEDEEMALISAGFAPVRIVANTLRFETAAIAAVSLGRAALARGGKEP